MWQLPKLALRIPPLPNISHVTLTAKKPIKTARYRGGAQPPEQRLDDTVVRAIFIFNSGRHLYFFLSKPVSITKESTSSSWQTTKYSTYNSFTTSTWQQLKFVRCLHTQSCFLSITTFSGMIWYHSCCQQVCFPTGNKVLPLVTQALIEEKLEVKHEPNLQSKIPTPQSPSSSLSFSVPPYYSL